MNKDGLRDRPRKALSGLYSGLDMMVNAFGLQV